MRTLALLVALVAALAPAGVPLAQTGPSGSPSGAPSAEGWRAFPAFNELTAVAAGPDRLWAAAAGGVFSYDPATGEVATATVVDGLEGGAVGALAFDAARGALWVGYETGVLERLDAETRQPTAFFALARADQFASRGVRRIRVVGDRLHLATDFGVVVLDAAAGRVLDTYARIGDVEAGTPVNDVIVAPLPDGRDGLWVAGEGGVHYAALGASNLQAPGAWTRADGFAGPGLSLAFYAGRVYAGGGPGGARDLYRQTDAGPWEPQLSIDNEVSDLAVDGGLLLAVDPFFAYALDGEGPSTQYAPVDAPGNTGLAAGPDGRLWVANRAVGLFPIAAPRPGLGVVAVSPEPVRPDGPLTAAITDLDVGADGVLWLVTGQLATGLSSSVSRFEDGAWASVRTNDPAVDVARASFLGATVGPDGRFFASSSGDGLTVFDPDGDGGAFRAVTYREANSSLVEILPDFLPVRDVAFDDDGAAWVSNEGPVPLHRFADGAWTGYPFPTAIPTSAVVYRLAVDGLDQKWLALQRNGLGVWDTGDPATAADDRARRFTAAGEQGTGLPGTDVRDVVVDPRTGRVWVGTDRGIAFVFAAADAFAPGDGALSWPVLAGESEYLLRDVAVNDLELDPAGQLWVATDGGAFLVNASADGVARTVTAATSPLPSDGVFRVDVDPRSGRVYFVTAEGLFSAPGDATRRVPDSDGLVAAPQPFRPAQDVGGVVVRGLSAPSSQVRVLTVAGDVVFAGEVAGGSFRWDGRDGAGRPVPSGVYLVSAAGSDGSRVTGKVAVLR